MDIWTSPPLELLLEVFRRLDVTGVVRCAGTCKPWRHAIISNGISCLRPRPDRFLPNLLLGFFFDKKLHGEAGVSLHHKTGPFNPAFAMPTARIDLALYDEPLSSRDGLLLLKGREVQDLCLYNTMTGDHTFISSAAFKADTYVIVTGYDLSPSDDLGVRVLAMKVEVADNRTFTLRHQQFFCSKSSASTWGPVKRSPEFMKNLYTSISRSNEVVCGGAVHWLGVWALDWFSWFDDDDLTADEIQAYTLAVDVRTERTWTTKLPDQCRHAYASCSLVLATSGDGRLSVVMDGRFHGDHGSCIQVWVLVGEDQWSLERTVAVPAVSMHTQLWMNKIVFCPRSGCVLFEVEGGDLVIEVETGSSRQIGHFIPNVPCGRSHSYSYIGHRYPYEMDWSTYLSSMKNF
ncbi:unnamed protein product [Urochloa decumbens]|uniref:F-box domain-containing protein n=1 Tax=Urochloa decumbens TaxID=240449 RepID=A0ABC9B103_9POAL